MSETITRETINYSIVGFDNTRGTITVQFDHVDFTVPVDLQLDPVTNLYPVGSALDSYIRNFCPLHVITRNINIKAGIANESAISSLVVNTANTSANTAPASNTSNTTPAIVNRPVIASRFITLVQVLLDTANAVSDKNADTIDLSQLTAQFANSLLANTNIGPLYKKI